MEAVPILVLLLYLFTGHVYTPMKMPRKAPVQYVCPKHIQAALNTHRSHLDPALFCARKT